MEFELFGDFISDAGKTTNVVAERSEKFVCDGADVGEIEVEDGSEFFAGVVVENVVESC